VLRLAGGIALRGPSTSAMASGRPALAFSESSASQNQELARIFTRSISESSRSRTGKPSGPFSLRMVKRVTSPVASLSLSGLMSARKPRGLSKSAVSSRPEGRARVEIR